MNEKEKMLNHMLYDPDGDNELIKDRKKCKDLCHEYNQLYPSQTNEQKEYIQRIAGSAPSDTHITAPFWCDYGYNIEIGNNFYSNHNLVILDCAKVTIGDNVFIAPDCGIYTAGHPIDKKRRNEGLEYAHPITIGNNVWIGGGVKIMPNVTVGNNVVIGSGSIVTKNIPNDVVAAGNPCRIIRSITNQDLFTNYDIN